MLPYCLGLLSLTPKPVQIASSSLRVYVYVHRRHRRRHRRRLFSSTSVSSPFPTPRFHLAISLGTWGRIKSDREGCRGIDSRGKTPTSILNLAMRPARDARLFLSSLFAAWTRRVFVLGESRVYLLIFESCAISFSFSSTIFLLPVYRDRSLLRKLCISREMLH